MKKLLGIIIFSLLFGDSVDAATATCMSGECDFFLSLHYEWAETNCYQTLFMEEVETNFMSFTIVETGEQCTVWDSR